MKTDPRKACANAEERRAWALVHDLVAHPLMALCGWRAWTLRFHDYTSRRARPRRNLAPGAWVEIDTNVYTIAVRETSVPGLYQARCPFMDHVYGTKAESHDEAAELAEERFMTLDPNFDWEA